LNAGEQPAVHARPPRERAEPVRRLRARAVALVVRERAREPRRGDLVPGRQINHRLTDHVPERQIGSVVIIVGADHAIDGLLQVVEARGPAAQQPGAAPTGKGPLEHAGRNDEPGRQMRGQPIAVALARVERERAGGHAAGARVVDARRQRGGRERVLVDDRQ
jgi:hypothetical protein